MSNQIEVTGGHSILNAPAHCVFFFNAGEAAHVWKAVCVDRVVAIAHGAGHMALLRNSEVPISLDFSPLESGVCGITAVGCCAILYF